MLCGFGGGTKAVRERRSKCDEYIRLMMIADVVRNAVFSWDPARSTRTDVSLEAN